jgi:KaiC/GvpD/RAD55 family RecA-like ATPase
MNYNPYDIETLADVQISEGFSATKKTGNEILDNFLSKESGLLTSAVYLFTGSPGAGKTTISNYIMAGVSSPESPAIFMSFEMPKQRIKKQFQGKIDMSNIKIVHSLSKTITTFEEFNGFLEYIKTLNPSILVIDSLQNVSKKINALEKHVTNSIIEFSQNMNCPSIIIGQCTKDGTYKGDSEIKHDIDGHLHADLDLKKGTRRLVFEKNRDGKAFEGLAYEFANDGSVVFVPFSRLLDKEFAWFKAQETLQELFADIIGSELPQMLKNGITIPQLKFKGTFNGDKSNESYHPMINMWDHSPQEFIQSTVFISMDRSRNRFTEKGLDQLRKQLGQYIDRFPQFKTVTDLFYLEFFVLMTQAVLGTEKEDKTFFKTLERIINNHA